MKTKVKVVRSRSRARTSKQAMWPNSRDSDEEKRETGHDERPCAHRRKKGGEEERTSWDSCMWREENCWCRCESLACKKSGRRAAVASACVKWVLNANEIFRKKVCNTLLKQDRGRGIYYLVMSKSAWAPVQEDRILREHRVIAVWFDLEKSTHHVKWESWNYVQWWKSSRCVVEN